MTLLSVSSLVAFYDHTQALFGLDLRLDEGEVLALMGRNGMGKSTTVKSLCRLLPTGGEIIFAGHNLAHLRSHQVARLGIGLVPEGRRCFGNLSVYENLMAAARHGYWNFARIAELFPSLSERQNQKAAALSGGEQQMLAIGRALMTNPRLLILDEATEGLAPIVRQEIWTVIARLKSETGLAILVIDKSVTELRRICDHACILERGTNVWSGAMPTLSAEIIEKYIGV